MFSKNEIKQTAEKIVFLTFYNAERYEAINISEFLAYEIIDLSEWMSSCPEQHNLVIKEILKYNNLSDKTKQIIEKLS